MTASQNQNNSIKLSNLDLYSDGSVDSIINKLNKYGITLVKKYVQESSISNLMDEFKFILSNKNLGCNLIRQSHPTNENGIMQTIDPICAQKEHNLPIIASLFRNELMNNICNEYYRPHEFTLNPEVLLTHLKESKNRILPWHFDRLQTLKFWIYLTDTNESNGAMEYAPGTHWEGRYRSQFHLSVGDLIREIPNDIPDDRIINGRIIECQAGDLMIFDPDGFHRGGVISPGNERLALRGDSFPNLGRKHADTEGPIVRVLGERTEDKAVNRNGLSGTDKYKIITNK